MFGLSVLTLGSIVVAVVACIAAGIFGYKNVQHSVKISKLQDELESSKELVASTKKLNEDQEINIETMHTEIVDKGKTIAGLRAEIALIEDAQGSTKEWLDKLRPLIKRTQLSDKSDMIAEMNDMHLIDVSVQLVYRILEDCEAKGITLEEIKAVSAENVDEQHEQAAISVELEQEVTEETETEKSEDCCDQEGCEHKTVKEKVEEISGGELTIAEPVVAQVGEEKVVFAEVVVAETVKPEVSHQEEVTTHVEEMATEEDRLAFVEENKETELADGQEDMAGIMEEHIEVPSEDAVEETAEDQVVDELLVEQEDGEVVAIPLTQDDEDAINEESSNDEQE